MSPVMLENAPTVEEVLNEVSRMGSVITDAVDEGVRSATKAMKQGYVAAEDAIEDARHAVKRNPFQAMGIVFAAGVAVGGLAVWLGCRRR